MRSLRPVILAACMCLTSWSLGACGTANPTPYPGQPEPTNGETGGQAAPNAPAEDKTVACADFGGFFDSETERCDLRTDEASEPEPDPTPPPDTAGGSDGDPALSGPAAHVVGVGVTGAPGEYTFSVTIESDDTGCDQYADWWEVVAWEDGSLLTRRILAHSHVDEQPFTRSGDPVAVAEDTLLVVRAHLSTTGYAGEAMVGTVEGGFVAAILPPGYAAELEGAEPQPGKCAY